MNYRLLNEVLIEWNESPKEDSDNVFLRSEDIKDSLRYFVYRLNRKVRIKIFNTDWPEYKKYRDKVWINGKHIELDNRGQTVDKFEPGEYRVYIEDIDKVTDMTHMFYGCEQLVSAFIPNSITSIGSSAFSGCTGLTSVTIPNSVTSIGSSAFYRCTGLTSVEIPNSVTSIGYNAFAYCTGLTSVNIPNSATSIGDNAFNGCSGLTSVTIPNSVTTIGDFAFYGCSGLTSVTIPNSVTSIGAFAFRYCKNLKKVYVEDINKFNQINFADKFADLTRYKKVKIIKLKK